MSSENDVYISLETYITTKIEHNKGNTALVVNIVQTVLVTTLIEIINDGSNEKNISEFVKSKLDEIFEPKLETKPEPENSLVKEYHDVFTGHSKVQTQMPVQKKGGGIADANLVKRFHMALQKFKYAFSKIQDTDIITKFCAFCLFLFRTGTNFHLNDFCCSILSRATGVMSENLAKYPKLQLLVHGICMSLSDTRKTIMDEVNKKFKKSEFLETIFNIYNGMSYHVEYYKLFKVQLTEGKFAMHGRMVNEYKIEKLFFNSINLTENGKDMIAHDLLSLNFRSFANAFYTAYFVAYTYEYFLQICAHSRIFELRDNVWRTNYGHLPIYTSLWHYSNAFTVFNLPELDKVYWDKIRAINDVMKSIEGAFFNIGLKYSSLRSIYSNNMSNMKSYALKYMYITKLSVSIKTASDEEYISDVVSRFISNIATLLRSDTFFGIQYPSISTMLADRTSTSKDQYLIEDHSFTIKGVQNLQTIDPIMLQLTPLEPIENKDLHFVIRKQQLYDWTKSDGNEIISLALIFRQMIEKAISQETTKYRYTKYEATFNDNYDKIFEFFQMIYNKLGLDVDEQVSIAMSHIYCDALFNTISKTGLMKFGDEDEGSHVFLVELFKKIMKTSDPMITSIYVYYLSSIHIFFKKLMNVLQEQVPKVYVLAFSKMMEAESPKNLDQYASSFLEAKNGGLYVCLKGIKTGDMSTTVKYMDYTETKLVTRDGKVALETSTKTMQVFNINGYAFEIVKWNDIPFKGNDNIERYPIIANSYIMSQELLGRSKTYPVFSTIRKRLNRRYGDSAKTYETLINKAKDIDTIFNKYYMIDHSEYTKPSGYVVFDARTYVYDTFLTLDVEEADYACMLYIKSLNLKRLSPLPPLSNKPTKQTPKTTRTVVQRILQPPPPPQ